MLHHDLQPLMTLADRVHHTFDEHGLAVKDIDIGIGDLAMGAERQADLRHPLKNRGDLVEICHTAG